LLIPVWTGQQTLTPVHRASQETPDESKHIADGFAYHVTLTVGDVQWQETRLVVHSLKHAEAKRKALDKRIEQAQQERERIKRNPLILQGVPL